MVLQLGRHHVPVVYDTVIACGDLFEITIIVCKSVNK
jgi:hypothetical protein